MRKTIFHSQFTKFDSKLTSCLCGSFIVACLWHTFHIHNVKHYSELIYHNYEHSKTKKKMASLRSNRFSSIEMFVVVPFFSILKRNDYNVFHKYMYGSIASPVTTKCCDSRIKMTILTDVQHEYLYYIFLTLLLLLLLFLFSYICPIYNVLIFFQLVFSECYCVHYSCIYK